MLCLLLTTTWVLSGQVAHLRREEDLSTELSGHIANIPFLLIGNCTLEDTALVKQIPTPLLPLYLMSRMSGGTETETKSCSQVASSPHL